jgi:NADPH:quinone reductase-like Zn-dependent oxidoreductase
MLALLVTEEHSVAVRDVPTPPIGAGEVLVKVVAVAQNPADWKLVEGAAPGTIAGHDYAGEVVQVGQGVTSLRIGDKVAGLDHGAQYTDRGAFAEYVRAEADLVWKIPSDTVSYEEAATMNAGQVDGQIFVQSGS